LILDELFALGPHIDSHNPRVRTEEPLPHLQRSSLATAYLEEYNVGIHKSPEMALVYGEIMLPLMNDALVIRQKVRPQGHIGFVLGPPSIGQEEENPRSGIATCTKRGLERQDRIFNRVTAEGRVSTVYSSFTSGA
jgi:hypothetical protein